ncbi:RagB/SusD family nutrient uptake outer membrane protein [Runella sp. CRIBMP]|uniref:RagB/SusD family nutrient uptake outer membrane protein n=1 Tax=Runella sp. CRIBMP TaxID=2683261 RepID=UPI0014125965|nr:RagB/SusD family nutrient uptake outer membrane protein [Runella sp. CRIBMP]NBB23058.1 RagB/SusD family nutrient uptake outer membrane protein [Runella sp. CRIBMP]
MKKIILYSILSGLMLTATSCDQEYLNPSAASETQVTTDLNGLITLCNGLQFRYTSTRAGVLYTAITASGLTTRELTVLNAGNTDEDQLRIGGANVTPSNGVLRNLWSQNQLVKANADLILKSVGSVAGDAGTKSGITVYASIFRALALGTQAQFWQQLPVETADNAKFVTREEALKEAVRTLESAATTLAATPVSTTFTGRIVPGIDLANTLQALIARFSIMTGDNAKALAAANKVDLTKKSSFNFDDAVQNPLFFNTFGNRNVTEPLNATLGLPEALRPIATDKRLAFYLSNPAGVPVGGVNLGRASFFTANNAGIPVYLPGEMLLIRAEASARLNDLAAATTALNAVLTKTTDAWGIGAALPEYAGANTADAILTEIYRQRSIELYLSGLRLEDSRRFNRLAPVAGNTASQIERNRTFYPYPLVERDNNGANTPADPAI